MENNGNQFNQQNLNQKILDKIMKQLNIAPGDIQDSKKLKNVVLITPDYLPRTLSDISIQSKQLAESLVCRGINTHVVAYDPWKVGVVDEIAGVTVHYIGNSIKSYSPLTWSITVGMEIGKTVADIYHKEGNIDLLHAHDWSMFPASINLQAALRKPLVVNYYSLQEQRNPGVCNKFTDAVKQIEWRGSQLSNRILVNEGWMKNELLKCYSPPEKKVNVVDMSNIHWTKEIERDYSWVLKNWESWKYGTCLNKIKN